MMKYVIFLAILISNIQYDPIIIPINGQSNALSAPLDETAYCHDDDRILTVSATDTVKANCSVISQGFVGVLGHLVAQRLNSYHNQQIIIINESSPGKTIDYFLPDKLNYRVMRNKINRFELNPAIMIFYQGERDAREETTKSDWVTSFLEIKEAWEGDYPSLEKILLIQIQDGCGAKKEHIRAIMDAQAQAAANDPKITLIRTAGLQQIDNCHLTYKSKVALSELINRAIIGGEN